MKARGTRQSFASRGGIAAIGPWATAMVLACNSRRTGGCGKRDGPQGGDEINLILPGNYGWPVSNGSHYGGADIPDHKPGDGYEAPKIWWTPSISPGALLIYRRQIPQWKVMRWWAHCLAKR
jgi:hypothetical protein